MCKQGYTIRILIAIILESYITTEGFYNTMAEHTNTPENKVSFKDTLNLPTTDFPIRANSKEDDPALVARWAKEGLYESSFMAHLCAACH